MLFQAQIPGSLCVASNLRLLHSPVIVLRGSKHIQTPIGLRYGARNTIRKHSQNIFRENKYVKRTAFSRSRISVVSAASSGTENPFKYPPQMEGLQSLLSQLPSAGVYVLGAAFVAALGGSGFGIAGSLAPESLKTVAKAAATAAGAALGGFLFLRIKEVRQSAAIIELSNLLSQLESPDMLTREAVSQIEAKYGAPLVSSSLEGLKSIYGTFVEFVIPAGDVSLTGQEAPRIQSFKQALGLSDTDAAPVHIDVGRRVLRGRLEAGSRGEDFDARKTFQKLIYVSTLVFGERQAAFLLPWARVFGLTDAQIQVARRDNAKSLFKYRVMSNGGLSSDRDSLVALKSYQNEVRLADDEAASVIIEAAQATLQNHMEQAIDCLKRRTRVRDLTDLLSAVRAAIDFNRNLAAVKGDAEVPQGVAAASLAGTTWVAGDGRQKDLREVFRSYLDERIARDAAFSDALAADAKDLQVIAGLGTKEAANIEDDVKEKAYRKLLREEFTSGRLDAAASKAEVLGELVDRVQWDSEAALELHKSLYRQKLSSLLEKKTLTDGDAEELARLQRLLCVPNEQKELIHRELCGSLFRDAVSSALGAGIDHFGFEDRAAVKSAFEGLRLDRSVAKDILAEVARKYLLQFISMSRNQRDRIAAAKELKKMVLFSNIVVAPLVEDLKTEEEKKKEEEEAKQQKELQELMAKAREEAAKEAAEKEKAESSKESEEQKPADEVTDTDKESVSAASDATASETQGQIEAQTEAQIETEKEKQEGEDEVKPKSLEKAQAAAASRSGGEKIESSGIVMKSQKDVTLAQDLELRDRLDIYRNFLLYCMTGDVVQGPMGVTMVTERDETEFARLSQLGDVLGLTQMDVYQVHQGLAEQAFKSQVQQTMGTGPLTAERAAALESVRSQMGLPKEAADKIIKGLQNQKLIAAMQEAKAQGNLTLDKVLEMKEAGVEPSSLMTKDGLQALYRSEIASRLSDGTGDFDSNRLLNELPGDLGLDSDRAGKVVKELASERKRATLVQAVSFLRQKKFSDTVKSLNNLRACAAALPDSGPEVWSEREEVADLYGLYCSKENDAERRASLQAVLGLTDEDASSLQTIVESGQFKLGLESEEEAEAFF